MTITDSLSAPMRSLGKTPTHDEGAFRFYEDAKTTHQQMIDLLKCGEINKLELVCKHALVRSPFDSIAWFYLAVSLIFFQDDGDISGKRAEGMEYLRHSAQMNDKNAIVTLQAIERYGENPDFFTFTPYGFDYFLQDFRLKCSNYNTYPTRIFIETQAVCNAGCPFCTYDRISRKGTKMSDALLDKLIKDMAHIPHRFQLNFNGINEPLADKRIFDLYDRAHREILQAILVIITNGSLLTAERQTRLFPLTRVLLNVSLNESDAEAYKNTMGLSFAKVIANLDALHTNVQQGNIRFPITLSRVDDGSPADERFREFVADRFPLFKCTPVERVDLDKVFTSTAPAPLIPCRRWYTQMVLATGDMALCCDDHHGGILKENVHDKSLLEIYNSPRHRAYRESFSIRDISPCRTCATACPFDADSMDEQTG